jgi:hypothetical protein
MSEQQQTERTRAGPAFTDAVRSTARLQRVWLDALTQAQKAQVEDWLAHGIRIGVLVFADLGVSCQIVGIDRNGGYNVLMEFTPDTKSQTNN